MWRRPSRNPIMSADAPTSYESIAEARPQVQPVSRPRREPVRVSVQSESPKDYRGDLLTIGVFSNGTLSSAAKTIDKAGKGRLSGVIQRGDLRDEVGSSLVLHDHPGASAERLLLLNAGRHGEFGAPAFRKLFQGAARALSTGVARRAGVALTDLEVPGRPVAWHVQQATRLIVDGAYHFAPPASTNGHAQGREHGAREIDLLVPGKVTPELERAVLRGQAIAEGMALARDLGNLPGNICNPSYLAATARTMGREFGFDVEVLERHDMEKLGMGAALAVGRASAQPCKFIVMNYARGGVSRPIVLVGKGVTFDSGGISLKPGANMDEMKFDMCGAAAVFGAMKVVARLALPLNVVAIVPAVEN